MEKKPKTKKAKRSSIKKKVRRSVTPPLVLSASDDQTSTVVTLLSQALSKSLALEIEHALRSKYTSSRDYARKARQIVANLKHNPSLAKGVLSRDLSAPSLVNMSVNEMATTLQRETREKAHNDAITQRLDTHHPPSFRLDKFGTPEVLPGEWSQQWELSP